MGTLSLSNKKVLSELVEIYGDALELSKNLQTEYPKSLKRMHKVINTIRRLLNGYINT